MQPDQNVTATLSYPPSYLILLHFSSWRSYFVKLLDIFFYFLRLVIRSYVILDPPSYLILSHSSSWSREGAIFVKILDIFEFFASW